jgi:hypothetical protein
MWSRYRAYVRRLRRNLPVSLGLAAVLLAIFEGSDHRLHVLPADASPAGVLLGAVLLAAGLTLAEPRIEHLWRRLTGWLRSEAASR